MFNGQNLVSGGVLLSKLTKNIAKHVEADQHYKLEVVGAASLLCSARLDIVAKYVYARAYFDSTNPEYARAIYLAHIMAFNGLVEADGSGKIGEAGFVDSFNSLLSSMASNGFSDGSVVPLSRDGVPLDGAHRIAAAMALRVPVNTVRLDLDSPKYDYEFFRLRGFPIAMSDQLAYEYAQLVSESRIVLLWPAAKGEEEKIHGMVRKYANIVYSRKIALNSNGGRNLTSVAYKRESWLGSLQDGFIGAIQKSQYCFSGDGPLRVFLIDCHRDLLQLKEEVRDLFNIGKHSVHINDFPYETVEISEILFNQNAVDFLNARVPTYFKNFNGLIGIFHDWISSSHHASRNYCIDGSSVLALLGIRDVNDLDIISGIKLQDEIDLHPYIDFGDSKTKYHHKSVGELVYDPANHFVFNGCKFISINILRELKINRGSPMDLQDVASLDRLLVGLPAKPPFTLRLRKWGSMNFVKGKIKLSLLKVRYLILLWIKKGSP